MSQSCERWLPEIYFGGEGRILAIIIMIGVKNKFDDQDLRKKKKFKKKIKTNGKKEKQRKGLREILKKEERKIQIKKSKMNNRRLSERKKKEIDGFIDQ